VIRRATSSNPPDLYTITLPPGIQVQTSNGSWAAGSNQQHASFDQTLGS
jgi:hypothetical protein